MTRWILRTGVSIAVIVLLLGLVPIGEVKGALVRTNPWVWGASLGVFLLGHVMNAMKFRWLLGARDTRRFDVVTAHFAGQAANLGLPGVAGGDLVRAAYLAPRLGTARVALASAADRIVDTAVVCGLVVVALPFAGRPPGIDEVVRRAEWWIGAAAIVGVIAAGVVWWWRPHPGAARAVGRLVEAARARKGALAAAVVVSAAVQSAFVLTNAWLAWEVGVSTSLAAWFVAWPLSKLVAVLPISLGGIGVRESVLVALLAPYGAPAHAVLASGLLWQAVLFVSGVMGFGVTQMVGRPVTPSHAAGGR